MYPFCMDYENMLPDSERKLGDWNFVADWRGEDRYDKKMCCENLRSFAAVNLKKRHFFRLTAAIGKP